jgi:hypothetical protein
MRAGDNPFRSERLHAIRYRLAGRSWDDLMARLAALDTRAALVGPEGHGKSTLLEAIGERLAARGFGIQRLRLRRDAPRFERGFLDRALAKVGPRDAILFDGGDHSGKRDWLRVARAARGAGGLLITTHAPGRLPTLHECSTGPEVLDDLLLELLGDQAARWRADARALWTVHAGNLREVFSALYDRFAEMPGMGNDERMAPERVKGISVHPF